MKRAVLVNPGRQNFGELQRDGNHTDDNAKISEIFGTKTELKALAADLRVFQKPVGLLTCWIPAKKAN